MEAKIKDPIVIRIGSDSNIMLKEGICENDLPLNPGVMFGDDHYGFILITDYNGKQKEQVFPTQCRLQATGMESDFIKIWEEGKNQAWRFDKKGTLLHSAFNDFCVEYKSKASIIKENYDTFMGESTIKNPINIKIAIDPDDSVILKDENVTQDYPLYPGVMLGTEHYGFVLHIETGQGVREVEYPTQNIIEAIGMDHSFVDDLKIFEKGKYDPWIFDFKGTFKQKASFFEQSKADGEYVEDCLNLSEETSKDCFTLQKKR